MEDFVLNQVKYGLKYVPVNIIKSFFIAGDSAEAQALRAKGFICGVCHPNEDYSLIKEANIGWIRIDIPFPYNEDGSETQSYKNFKARAKGYADEGIKVMAVTPYPKECIEHNADIRTAEGTEAVKKMAQYLAKDLQGIVAGFQITNEMGIPRFTIPITMDEAVKFIAVQLEAIENCKGDILVGYNSAGPQADLHANLRPYHKYCDYVGLDMYLGCFYGLPGFMWCFDAMIRYLWALTGKPVLVQEFGYIGDGAPKTKEQKKQILARYGASSIKDAKEHIVDFVEKLPEGLKNQVKMLSGGDASKYFELVFHGDLTNHLYCELPRFTKIPGFDHTPEGQAKFYEHIFERFYKMKYVGGAFIYCWSDSDHCYVCGQKECPTETRWGLVTCDGKPKPAYYAIKKALSKIK